MNLRIFDLHCDTFSKMYDESLNFDDSQLAVGSKSFYGFEHAVQMFAVWLSDEENDIKSRYREVLSSGLNQLKRFSDSFKLFETKDDLLSNESNQPVIAMLSLENGGFIDSSEEVERLYFDGIRTVSLTWNYDNRLGGGAKGEKGLTSLGREVIGKMNDLGMILDVSHLNRKSFFEAAEIADRIVATHSGCSKFVANPRNLTDDQIRVLAEKKGLLGLCYYPEFIGTDVFFSLFNAIQHLTDMGFSDIISVGSDFDGAKMSVKLSKPNDVLKLNQYLKAQGVEKSLLSKVFYENACKYYSQNLN